ncbi:hypothetical protein LCGC14_2662910, partial [marine sediment metagenome]
ERYGTFWYVISQSAEDLAETLVGEEGKQKKFGLVGANGLLNENKKELMKLGVGTHHGEWWGSGIQRRYNLDEKRFSLFNTGRWVDTHLIPIGASGFSNEYSEQYLHELKKQSHNDKLEYCPKGCYVVPILYEGLFSEERIGNTLMTLKEYGSKVSLGFMKPEGIVIYHKQGNMYFKKTIENDEQGKG